MLSKKNYLLITAILFLIFNLFYSTNFKIDASSDTLILQNDEDFQYFKYYNDIFPNKNFLVLAVKSDKIIDLGNSGTSARLLTGLLSSQNFDSILVGDTSLSKRPMARITKPLELMGAKFANNHNKLPLKIYGKKLHKITTHSFRAFFISQFEKTYSGFGHVLSGHGKYMKQYERFTIGEKIEKYIETEKYLLIYSKHDESKKELRELKTKVSRLEELLSQKGINLDDLK